MMAFSMINAAKSGSSAFTSRTRNVRPSGRRIMTSFGAPPHSGTSRWTSNSSASTPTLHSQGIPKLGVSSGQRNSENLDSYPCASAKFRHTQSSTFALIFQGVKMTGLRVGHRATAEVPITPSTIS